MFAAVLDTCVLWPSLQRDFLLSMAAEGLYRPLWSEVILEELGRHETLKKMRRYDTPEAQARTESDHLIDQMRTYFDDALVTGWEGLEGTYDLPDPDDEHVVAAAVVGGAGAIVTDNLKHFPTAKVPSHIKVIPARDFAADTVDVDPERAANALQTLAARHQRPPCTPIELLETLRIRYGMDDVSEILAGML